MKKDVKRPQTPHSHRRVIATISEIKSIKVRNQLRNVNTNLQIQTQVKRRRIREKEKSTKIEITKQESESDDEFAHDFMFRGEDTDMILDDP